jgi:hypothetical protein
LCVISIICHKKLSLLHFIFSNTLGDIITLSK